MAEGIEGQPPPELPQNSEPQPAKGKERRGFIKLAAKGLAAGAAAFGFKKELAPPVETGIDTKYGIFYSLYERHDKAIEASDIPDSADAVFQERSSTKWQTGKASNVEIILRAGKDEIVNKLASKQIKLVYGDITLDKEDETDKDEQQVPALMEPTSRRLAGSIIIGGSSYVLNSFKEGLEKWQNKSASKEATSRRKFFNRSLAKVGVVLGAPAAAQFLPLIHGFDESQQQALSRVIGRLQGLSTHLLPEEHILFFRNVVMSLKLLDVAEQLNQGLGRKPNIVFNVGSAHSGIEDFLRLGPDFCRWLITHYPNNFLRHVIDLNDGETNFSSSRILTLPENLPVAQLREALKTRYSDDSREYLDRFNQTVQSQTIVDQKLEKVLKARFGAENERKKREVIDRMSRVLIKHLNPAMMDKFNRVFDKLKALDYYEFRKYFITDQITSKDSEMNRYMINLPELGDRDPSVVDILVIEQKKGGRLAYEEINMFVDVAGALTKNHNRADWAVIPQEKLIPIIQDSFLNAPQDLNSWKYQPPNTREAPMVGQAYIRSEKKERGVSNFFHMSQDGREVIIVHYL